MLSKYHFINSHPILYEAINSHSILYEALSKLFLFMFKLGYVPNDFGKGLIIPIQKDNSIKGVQKLTNFRGITLSSIISKVFEHCILLLFRGHLKSNDRQFEFKKNLGCSRAIYCVRNIVNTSPYMILLSIYAV